MNGKKKSQKTTHSMLPILQNLKKSKIKQHII